MARKKSNGMTYSNPRNQTGSGGPDSPDMKGDDVYWGGFDEVLGKHLQTDSMVSSSNSESGADILGGVAPNEPDPMKKKVVT